MAAIDKKELWVAWTHDAVANFVLPDEVDDPEDLAAEMADIACNYADEMLEEFDRRFERGGGGGRRRKRKKDDNEGED